MLALISSQSLDFAPRMTRQNVLGVQQNLATRLISGEQKKPHLPKSTDGVQQNHAR